MRLDWIFLPKENPCAKFYIIIITIIIIVIIIIRKFVVLVISVCSLSRHTAVPAADCNDC